MKVVNSKGDDWDSHIDPIVFSYRVSQQASTHLTPFELMYGVKARLPIDLDHQDCDVTESSEENKRNRIQLLGEGLMQQRDLAKVNILKAQQNQKKQYDMKHASPTYNVGDLVLRYNRRRDTRMGDKLSPRYTGPFVISEVLGRGVYRVKDGDKIMKSVVNASNLKPYVSSATQSVEVSSFQSPAASKSVVHRTNLKPLLPSSSPQKRKGSSPRSPAVSKRRKPNMWIADSNLNVEDKLIMAGEAENGWLNDRHIDAINYLIDRHMGGENAVETSLLFQSSAGFSPVCNETIRVIYAHKHWVATALVGDMVYVSDSMNQSGNINEHIAATLKQIYGFKVRPDGLLEVAVTQCTQQSNDRDCGIYATAFAFEWACNGINSSLRVNYSIPEMRQHLISCLEEGRVTPFPKRRAKRAPKDDSRKIVLV